MVRIRSRLILFFIFLLAFHHEINARDFMERPRAIVFRDELSRERSSGEGIVSVLPAGYAESSFHYQLFRNTPEDKFQIRSFTHFGVVDVGRFRSTVYYGNFMFSGPVNEGDTPGAEAAQWMMNAVQFEYGITLQYMLGDWTILSEYSRRSYHPLRKPFAQPSADIARIGVSPPWLHWRGLVFESLLRFGWADLYDFWGSDLPLPRALYTLSQGYELRYRFRFGGAPAASVVPALEAFALALLDTNVRRSGGLDTDVALQSGFGIGAGEEGRLEIYLDYFYSKDTEQRKDVPTRADLLGYGIRLWITL